MARCVAKSRTTTCRRSAYATPSPWQTRLTIACDALEAADKELAGVRQERVELQKQFKESEEAGKKAEVALQALQVEHRDAVQKLASQTQELAEQTRCIRQLKEESRNLAKAQDTLAHQASICQA